LWRPSARDVPPDGKRFIAVMPASQSQGTDSLTQIQVVLNFFEELKARVRAK